MPTVLLADDADVVRKLCCRILEEHGCIVLEAVDGREALSLARNHHAPIDLLITDMVMPELGGLELSRAFRDVHPAAGVLFISGSHAEELEAAASFLAKPFTPQALLDRVDELLSDRSAALDFRPDSLAMLERAHGGR